MRKPRLSLASLFPPPRITGTFLVLGSLTRWKGNNRRRMNDDANRTFALFTEAVDLPDGERAVFLDRACAGDEILRAKVEVLLKIHRRTGEFLEQPPDGLAVKGLPRMSVGEKPGDWIGRYKLLQQIGEGGCGVVFMAEQE